MITKLNIINISKKNTVGEKIFLDSDVILDVLLERSGFYLAAANLIALVYQNRIAACTSSVAFVNVHYFLDKFDRNNKFKLLTHFRSFISIIEVGEKEIDLALKSGLLTLQIPYNIMQPKELMSIS